MSDRTVTIVISEERLSYLMGAQDESGESYYRFFEEITAPFGIAPFPVGEEEEAVEVLVRVDGDEVKIAFDC